MAGQIISDIRRDVEKYFKVYDAKLEADGLALSCMVEPATMEERFDALRLEFVPKGLIPLLLHEGGEHIIFVTRRPAGKYRPVKVNLVMLVLTVVTTVFAGAEFWVGYNWRSFPKEPGIGDVFSAAALGNGALFFALPLLLILGIHELGHYTLARKHKVAASLPFFIPMLPPLGTMGAFISLRDPIPNRKALLDIGVAGPIAGFVVAVPMTLLGLYLTNAFAAPVKMEASALVYLGEPLLFQALGLIMPTGGNYLIHPTAWAGWVGFLVTAINLLPAGQLDGGHIFRALFGEKTKYFSYTVIVALFIMALTPPALTGYNSGYAGWVFLAFFIVFLGLYHPPPLNDLTPLDTKRKAVGLFAIFMLITCFTPVPLREVPPHYDFTVEADPPYAHIEAGGNSTFTLSVNNTGNSADGYMLRATALTPGWNATVLTRESRDTEVWARANLSLSVSAPAGAPPGSEGEVNVTVISKRLDEAKNAGASPLDFLGGGVRQNWTAKQFTLRSVVSFFNLTAPGGGPVVPVEVAMGGRSTLNLTLVHLEGRNSTVNLSIAPAGEQSSLLTGGWSAGVEPASARIAAGGKLNITVTVGAPLAPQLLGKSVLFNLTARTNSTYGTPSARNTTFQLQFVAVHGSGNISAMLGPRAPAGAKGGLVPLELWLHNGANSTARLRAQVSLVPDTPGRIPPALLGLPEGDFDLAPGTMLLPFLADAGGDASAGNYTVFLKVYEGPALRDSDEVTLYIA